MNKLEPGDVFIVNALEGTVIIVITAIFKDTNYFDCKLLDGSREYRSVDYSQIEFLLEQGTLRVLKQPNLNNLKKLYL